MGIFKQYVIYVSMKNNKPLIIIGGAGHGCVIEACVNDNRNRFGDFERRMPE